LLIQITLGFIYKLYV